MRKGMVRCSIWLGFMLGISLFVDGKGLTHLNKGHKKSSLQKDVPGSKRMLWQFKSMIECVTGRSTFDFVNYGNYCGWGGSGIALDDLDRCCQVHDECYGQWDECRPKSNVYAYELSGEHPSCEITCSPTPKNTECERAICLCDKVAADCFGKSKYNPKHKKPTFSLW